MEVIEIQDVEAQRTLLVGIPSKADLEFQRGGSERFSKLSAQQEQQVLERWLPREPVMPPRKVKARPITPHTYLVGAEGSPLVKIGYTGGVPLKRLASLQTGQPMALSLLWSIPVDIEDELHERFAAYRVRGEWFDLTPLGDAVLVVQAAADELTKR